MKVFSINPNDSQEDQLASIAYQLGSAARDEIQDGAQVASMVVGICPACIEQQALICALAAAVLTHKPKGQHTDKEVLAAIGKEFTDAYFALKEAAERQATDDENGDLGSAESPSNSHH